MVPALPCRKDQRIGIAAEALSKSSACGCLHRGSDGGARSRRLYSQELLTSQNALLHQLLALQQALLCLQQPLLRALRAQAFRLLRLQPLHALLQPIDALLVLHALARECLPALATSITKVPSGERWLHEIKLDGYRVQVHIKDAAITVFTRRGNGQLAMAD